MLSPVEEIKSRLDIVEVVQDYVPLKVAGTNLKGLCPFHREKSPSFMVHKGRQRWHCFGCNEGGDVFSFIQKIENVDFKEALELLAKRANVELKIEDPQVRSERARMKETLALAARWFQAHLNAAGGQEAREYLKQQRGLDDATITEWQIGFAPDSWEGLVTALQKRGHTMHELIAAGMAIPKREGRGCYDRFRGRIMFPIADGNSTVVGFTGRLLHERPDAGGKYVNTPETVLYKKSMVLFGLHKAREGIKEQKYALIVEGQMDVIALWQYGYRHAVASSGTAFTQEQLRLLKRYTDTLALCFDADAGGQAAALRSIEAAWNEGFRVQVVAIPRALAKDPDEFVRKDIDAFEKTLKGRELFLDYLYRRAFAQHDKADVDGKKAIAQEILGACVKLADPIEQDHYIKRLASDLNIHEASLRDAMKRLVIPAGGQFIRQQGGTSQNTPPKKSQEETVAEMLIEAILVQPEVIEKVAEILEAGDMPAAFALLYKDCVLWYSKNTICTSDNLRSFLEASYPEAISLIESLITKRELLHQSRENSERPDEQALLKESLTLARTLKRIALKRRIDVYSHTLKKIEQDKEIDTRRVQVEEISAKIAEASQALASLDAEEDIL